MARTPRVLAVEGAPAEPDLLDNAPPPREAETLIGHHAARAAIVDAFNNAPPQGIILEGPRGIGKATLAFRLAKGLLSGAPTDKLFDAQSDARACHQVGAGTHPGVLHLTRAYDEKTKRFRTELSVDTVRRIIPFLGSTAAGGGWRVVIVDAVDDM
ncbi:MAG: DNA polymerase III subunit delta', partial [Pseudomonadota bacterium]